MLLVTRLKLEMQAGLDDWTERLIVVGEVDGEDARLISVTDEHGCRYDLPKSLEHRAWDALWEEENRLQEEQERLRKEGYQEACHEFSREVAVIVEGRAEGR
jgi:hypothetical protein